MKIGLKDMKKAYKNVKIDKIEVFVSRIQIILSLLEDHSGQKYPSISIKIYEKNLIE